MLSLLAIVAWHHKRQYIWLSLSALAISLSISIKLFTGFLIPIILLGILLGEFTQLRGQLDVRDLLRPLVLWVVVSTIPTMLIALFLVGPGYLTQLYQSHLVAVDVIQREIFSINYHLRDAMTMLFLSSFGIFFTILEKRWLTFYLILWAGTAYMLLLRHSPVWYHHQLLVTVPAAMLAGIAVGELVRLIPRNLRERNFFSVRMILSALALVAFGLVLYDQIPDIFPKFERGANLPNKPLRANQIQSDVFQSVEKYAPETHWMVTDMPMFAFRFDLPIPPNLVVFSTKRLKTNLLTEEELHKTIQDYNPEQVLLSAKLPGIEPYLGEHYQLVYTRRNVDLYIRNDLYDKHKNRTQTE